MRSRVDTRSGTTRHDKNSRCGTSWARDGSSPGNPSHVPTRSNGDPTGGDPAPAGGGQDVFLHQQCSFSSRISRQLIARGTSGSSHRPPLMVAPRASRAAPPRPPHALGPGTRAARHGDNAFARAVSPRHGTTRNDRNARRVLALGPVRAAVRRPSAAHSRPIVPCCVPASSPQPAPKIVGARPHGHGARSIRAAYGSVRSRVGTRGTVATGRHDKTACGGRAVRPCGWCQSSKISTLPWRYYE